MNTRRIPFQFSTTDPLARQRELEKRFGLQPTCPKMYVDVNNPLSMGSKETSSPRLQHRVPIFAEGYDKPIYSSSVDSMASVPDNKKPNVRVIPIEVEGADGKSQRHRTYSGPAGILKDNDNLASERNVSPFKRFNFENLSRSPEPKPNVEPRVYNIPIQVEGADEIYKSPKVTVSKQKCKTPSANGCSLSKSSSKVESSKIDNLESSDKKQTDHPKNDVELLLKKIEEVLIEFKTYESEVLEFNGTSKDKQYRYLDEMLTRCMLRLDDIDTMGNEEIRQARKNAVKKIQASIDLLESKANVESTEVPKVQTVQENGVDGNNSNDIEMQDNQAKDNVVVTSENEASSSEVKEMELSTYDSEELNEVSERIVNNNAKTTCESNSQVEPPEMIQNKADVTEMEMSEVTPDKMTSSENTNSCDTQKLDMQLEGRIQLPETDKTEVDNVMQSERNLTSFLQKQQNNMPEIEMSEETNLDEVNPMNNTHSSEILKSNNKGIEQNEVLNKIVTNDVEMLDEKDLTSSSVEESLSLNETEENKIDINTSKEASEVEMTEIRDISSKESGEKVECETVEKIVGDSSDYSEQKTDYNTVDPPVQVASVSSKDAEMEDIPSTLVDTAQSKTCNKCISDLCEQGDKCASNHSEKANDSLIIEKKELL